MGMNSLEEGAALDTGSLEAGVVGERVSLTEGSISRPKSPQPPRPPSPRPTPPTTRRLLAAGGEPPASTRLTDVNQLGVKQVGRTGKTEDGRSIIACAHGRLDYIGQEGTQGGLPEGDLAGERHRLQQRLQQARVGAAPPTE